MHDLFYVFLLEQDIIKKRQIDRTTFHLEFNNNRDNDKKYEFQAINPLLRNLYKKVKRLSTRSILPSILEKILRKHPRTSLGRPISLEITQYLS